MIEWVVVMTETDDLTTAVYRDHVGTCARNARAVGGEDAVDNGLHDSGEAEENDGGEYLAKIGANGAPLQREVLQELREMVAYM